MSFVCPSLSCDGSLRLCGFLSSVFSSVVVNLMCVGEFNFPTYLLHSNEFLSVPWFLRCALQHWICWGVPAISFFYGPPSPSFLCVVLLLVFLFLSISGTLSSFPKRDYLLQIPAEFLHSPQDCLEPHNNQSMIILSSQPPERSRENMERWI